MTRETGNSQYRKPSETIGKSQEEIRLGIIGMSSGNGHPYSWSAIFNGYIASSMKHCPFPSIPEYLSKQDFPNASIKGAKVTKIWCDNYKQAEDIALCTKISEVADRLDQLTEDVDAVLLARDDAENHLKHALPILEAGIPIFIDKPIGFNLVDTYKLLGHQAYRGQIFTCSALRYDLDLVPTAEELASIGNLNKIVARVPKSWSRYAVHVIEPVMAHILKDQVIRKSRTSINESCVEVNYQFDSHYELTVGAFRHDPVPIEICYEGSLGRLVHQHVNSFSAFKKALEYFIGIIRSDEKPIPERETLQIVEMIEAGIPHES